VKAHPPSALLHVPLKRSALRGVFRPGIEKDHHLIRSKEVRIQITPIGCGVEAEIVFRGHLRKPALGFVQEADVCRILFARKERDDSESRLPAAGA